MIYTYDVTNEFISDLDTKNYTTKEFMSLAKPFIHFMAYGNNTYAFEN